MDGLAADRLGSDRISASTAIALGDVSCGAALNGSSITGERTDGMANEGARESVDPSTAKLYKRAGLRDQCTPATVERIDENLWIAQCLEGMLSGPDDGLDQCFELSTAGDPNPIANPTSSTMSSSAVQAGTSLDIEQLDDGSMVSAGPGAGDVVEGTDDIFEACLDTNIDTDGLTIASLAQDDPLLSHPGASWTFSQADSVLASTIISAS